MPARNSRPRRRGWRIAGMIGGTTLGALVVALVVALVGYSVATAPASLPGRSPLYAFNPDAVGRTEQKAWAAYYYRQWPQLFDLMLRMTRSAFGLSLPEAVYASYLNTQAQIVWARQGAQDGLAKAYMLTFYEYIHEPVGGQYDSHNEVLATHHSLPSIP